MSARRTYAVSLTLVDDSGTLDLPSMGMAVLHALAYLTGAREWSEAAARMAAAPTYEVTEDE
jgi:hypothetical protein